MAKGHQLDGVIAFLTRDTWREPFEEVFEEHIGHALETLDIEFEELEAALGPDWRATLWGCAFEDFLTRTLEPDGRNLVEDYLKRRGFKEGARTKGYLRGLRHSIMSLYEVSEIRPGESLLARDLIRGGEPTLVHEKSATRTLKPWDRIAARIVDDGHGSVFGGGLLPCSPAACEMLLGGLAEAVNERDDPAGGAEENGLAAIGDDRLRLMAPLFTTGWLLDVVPRALGEDQPEIHNADGDPLLLHDLRFPFAKGVRRDTVVRRLCSEDALERADEDFWNWLGEPSVATTPADRPSTGLSYEVTMEDGRAVLGNIEIQGRDLVLSVNSVARAERGAELLDRLLGDNLGAPTISIRTIAEMRAERADRVSDIAEIPVEVATPIVHELLEARYRRLLDEPLPALGDVSPREATGSKDGRLMVAGWLKLIENSAAQQPEGDPLRTYDTSWMWRELGVEDLRR